MQHMVKMRWLKDRATASKKNKSPETPEPPALPVTPPAPKPVREKKPAPLRAKAKIAAIREKHHGQPDTTPTDQEKPTEENKD